MICFSNLVLSIQLLYLPLFLILYLTSWTNKQIYCVLYFRVIIVIYPFFLLYHLFFYYFLLFQGESAQLTGASRHTSSSYARENDWRVNRRTWTWRVFGRAWELAWSSKVNNSRRSKPIILLIFSIIPIISNVRPGFSVW